MIELSPSIMPLSSKLPGSPISNIGLGVINFIFVGSVLSKSMYPILDMPLLSLKPEKTRIHFSLQMEGKSYNPSFCQSDNIFGEIIGFRVSCSKFHLI